MAVNWNKWEGTEKSTKLPRGRRRGQALVETSLLSVVLALFMAAAVDFGRAAYTTIIVTNMAGEGAAYAAIFPYRDSPNQGSPSPAPNASCSNVPGDIWNSDAQSMNSQSIQGRVRRLAVTKGLIVEAEDLSSMGVAISVEGNTGCEERCTGRTITVNITYRLDDLFLPNLIGLSEIPITKSASQIITGGKDCP